MHLCFCPLCQFIGSCASLFSASRINCPSSCPCGVSMMLRTKLLPGHSLPSNWQENCKLYKEHKLEPLPENTGRRDRDPQWKKRKKRPREHPPELMRYVLMISVHCVPGTINEIKVKVLIEFSTSH